MKTGRYILYFGMVFNTVFLSLFFYNISQKLLLINNDITKIESKLEKLKITKFNDSLNVLTSSGENNSVLKSQHVIDARPSNIVGREEDTLKMRKTDIVEPESMLERPDSEYTTKPISSAKPELKEETVVQSPNPVNRSTDEVLYYSSSSRKYYINVDVRKGARMNVFKFEFINDTPYDIKIGNQDSAIVPSGLSIGFPYRRTMESNQATNLIIEVKNIGNQREFEVTIPVKSSRGESNNIVVIIGINLIE